MTKIFSLIGRKGGITKTTLSVNLAAGCARAGLKTLLVDADGQGNASTYVRLQPHDAFHSLVLGDAEFADVLKPVPVDFHGQGDLWLLSSWNLQQQVEGNKETPSRIYDRFSELEGVFDVVIVDTSPGTTEVHAGFYYTSDYVLLPTVCDFMSIKSLESTFSYLAKAAEEGAAAGFPVAEILGIIPNRFAGAQKVQQANVGYLRGRYDQQFTVFPFLRDLTVWLQAAQFKQSIFCYAPADDYGARRQARMAAAELSPVLDSIVNRVALAQAS